MGNKQASWQHRRPFSLSEWEFIQANAGRGLFRNRITGQHSEEYLLRVPQNDKIAYERRSNRCEEYLVNVLHCQVFTNFDDKYTLIDFTVRVFLERIVVRLNEIAQLPADAVPLLLFDCLLGFKKICQESGPVRVTPSMIGFLQNKELRVWSSHNFLENFPQRSISVSQATMVEDIFHIFDKYSDEYTQRPDLQSFSQGLQLVAKLRCIDKEEIKLVRIANELTQVKFVSGRAEKHEKSPPAIRQSSRPHDANISGIRTRTDTESKLSAEGMKRKQEQGKPKKDTPFSVSFVQSHAHQRKVSTGDHVSNNSEYHFLQGRVSKQGLKHIVTQKSKLTIGLDSARTTSNNVPIYNQRIEVDGKDLQLELLDDKKPKQSKLRLIREALTDQKTDIPVRKICRIYNYAIQFDPLMYHELQKVAGRISNINNQHLIRKIIEISERESEPEAFKGVVQSESEPTWKQPKRDIAPYVPSIAKQDSEERIRRILMDERKKRGATGLDSRKSDINHTFFGIQALRKKVATGADQEAPRLSEAPPKQDCIPLENLASPTHFQNPHPNHPHKEQHRQDKGKIMKIFKEEVEKLLDF